VNARSLVYTWLIAALFAPATAQAGTPRIVALGDSLTSGRGIGRDHAYPAILQKRLEDDGYKYEVINAGVSGDTTDRALRRYRDALDADVQVLIVALGANDGLRGVPVDHLESNLSAIISDAQARGIDVILIGMDALPIQGWQYSVAFHRAYEDLAARFNIPLVPFMMVNIMSNPSLMQSDRVHPNRDGARAIADLIWPRLKPLLRNGRAPSQ
jgi:acyl-CoA thioesterase I